MINVSFEVARNICGRESAPPNRVRLVLNRRTWVTILAFVGCLDIASIALAQTAQEAQSVSCEEKCSIEQKQCIDSQQTEELCAYDYKQCSKACAAK